MLDVHLQTLKRNKLQKWLLGIGTFFFIIAMIFLFVNNGLNINKSTDYSQETLTVLLQKANKSYSEGKYSDAIPYLTKAAEYGSAKAQYSLGYMYKNGEGVTPDMDLAREYFQSAANQNHAKAKKALKDMDK